MMPRFSFFSKIIRASKRDVYKSIQLSSKQFSLPSHQRFKQLDEKNDTNKKTDSGQLTVISLTNQKSGNRKNSKRNFKSPFVMGGSLLLISSVLNNIDRQNTESSGAQEAKDNQQLTKSKNDKLWRQLLDEYKSSKNCELHLITENEFELIASLKDTKFKGRYVYLKTDLLRDSKLFYIDLEGKHQLVNIDDIQRFENFRMEMMGSDQSKGLTDTELQQLIPLKDKYPHKKNMKPFKNLLQFIENAEKDGAADIDQYKVELILVAAQQDDPEAFSLLKEHNISLSHTLLNNNALHLAICDDDAKAIKVLLKYSPELVKKIMPPGYTPLTFAASATRINAMRALLSVNPDLIKERDNFGKTVLHHAAIKENSRSIKFLFEEASCNLGEILEIRDNDGYTALHYAVEGINIETVRLLTQNGANVLALQNPLLAAVKNFPIFRMIYERIPKDVQQTQINFEQNGITPLLAASVLGDDRIVRCLLNSGADVNHQNIKGLTPLMAAAFFNHYEVVETLLNAGADINKTTHDGILTATVIASVHAGDEILDALLERQPIIKVKNGTLDIREYPKGAERDSVKEQLRRQLNSSKILYRDNEPEHLGKLYKKKKYRILAVDGGGIRGLIPALVLAELEKDTNLPISDLFDVFAGTSTGGIITLGLNAPIKSNMLKPKFTANDLVEIYKNDGNQIYRKSWSQFFGNILIGLGALAFLPGIGLTLSGVIKSAIRGINMGAYLTFVGCCMTMSGGTVFFLGLFFLVSFPKYTRNGLDTYLRDKFGDLTLKDSIAPILITSWDATTKNMHVFTKYGDEDKDISFWQAGAATSAAPVYFDESEGRYSDGGLVANNPTQVAINYVLTEYKANLEDIQVISLGTGKPKGGFTTAEGTMAHYLRKRFPGILGWAPTFIDIMTDSERTHQQVKQLFSNHKDNYHRIQFELDKRHALDDLGAVSSILAQLRGNQTANNGQNSSKPHYPGISGNSNYKSVKRLLLDDIEKQQKREAFYSFFLKGPKVSKVSSKLAHETRSIQPQLFLKK